MSAFTKDQLGEPCVVALHRGFESANGTEPDTSLCNIPPLSADIARHPFSEERAAVVSPRQRKGRRSRQMGGGECFPASCQAEKQLHLQERKQMKDARTPDLVLS